MNPRLFALLAVAGMAISACSSVPNDRFYTLIDPAQQTNITEVACASVAINSVTLPQAVDRTELVLRNGTHGVTVMDGQRWAESLKNAIPRVLAGDLATKLQCANISTQADNASRDAQYMVWVDITRFDSVLGQGSTLDALWGVRNAAGNMSRKGSSHFTVAAHGGTYDDLVTAHAGGLALLSADIAVQIKELQKSGN